MAELRETSFCDGANASALTSLTSALFQQKQAGVFCDVIMKVCDIEIYAHSNVLAACSPYFNTFLAQDLPRQFCQRSPQVIEIQIDGVEPNSMYEEAVSHVVDYMYTGELVMSDQNVGQINEIGRIMQMDSVGQQCDLFLSGLLTSERKQVLRKKEQSRVSRLKSNKYMSMVSVATQVFPKFLGARADLADAAVNTDSVARIVKAPTGKPRGRPRKIIQDEEAGTITQDVLSQALEEVRELEEEQETVEIVERDLDEPDYEEEMEEGEAQEEPSSSIRRSSRRAKPKKFADYEEIEFIPRKKIKLESDDVIIMAEKEEMSAEKSAEGCQTLFDLAAAAEEIQKETTDNGECGAADTSKETEVYEEVQLFEGEGEEESPQSSEKKPRAKSRIKVEREYKHKPDGKFQCERCSFATNSVKAYGAHNKQHKIDNNQCYFCDAAFEDKESTLAHMATHAGPDKFLCRFCNANFKARTQLNIHLPKHFNIKPFICEICSMGFKWKHALNAHMIVHSNRKDHVCDVCGYATAHKNQLTSHKRIHTGETLKCLYPGCDYQALKAQNMKYHLMTHSGDKPHQCEVCGQAFSLKKNLRRHMVLHSTGNKRGCKMCDFTSPRADKLKEHLLRSHGVGTPPEKRMRVTDLVAEAENQRVLSPNKLPDSTIIQPDDITDEQKPIERYIIEIETDGTKQQLEIAPNQIMVDPTGTEHVLSTHGITELGHLEIAGSTVEFATSTIQGEGMAGHEGFVEGVHYTEVMVSADEVIPELVEQVEQYEDSAQQD
ncbi:hypothetical protein CAPTEDRAFT_222192 [Capitella teleta]|uniref:BTB domain-containing protein n=1 Tax=Capitella teleta TaxID=283909 RepID=R7TI17_CAPTE|nr:hypothetical protein CAPTEDRAFT_222192 [Capitella teleta]|eukprot:ELT93127.1 hypothetical protein CAPTEDRAFT_222192 [Capitella teleta]